MGVIKNIYRILGYDYLEKHERLVVRDGHSIKFKCSHCEKGLTSKIRDGQATDSKFSLFCNECGFKEEYLIKGIWKPVGMILMRDEFSYFKVLTDGSLKFIGGESR